MATGEMGAAPIVGSVGVCLPRLARAAWAYVEPLWVAGLALGCLLIGHLVFRSPWVDLDGKRYDWAQYLVVGAVVPALLFGAPLLWRWRGWPTAAGGVAKRLLALGCLVGCGLFWLWGWGEYGWDRLDLPVALALAQTVLMNRPARGRGMSLGRVAAVFVVALTGWTVTLALSLETLVRPPVFFVGFAVALVLVCAATWDREDGGRPGRFRPWAPANLVGIAFIGLMSLRTEHLFAVKGDNGALHHWAPWVGSAELVRQGGWLLWDVPSMYGFLNILPLAALPTATPWQALYLLSAVAFFLVGCGFFFALRALGPGPLNWCFALAMAIGVPMFGPTYDAAGPVEATFVFPNFGAYRWVWCFLLLAILVWEVATEERSRRQALILVGGCVAWVVGVLWSPESAVFCSGAWLPAYLVYVLRRTAAGPGRWRRTVAWLALPVALLGAAVGVVAAVYAVGLGRLPDWAAYLDFVVGLGASVLVVVNDPTGPVLAILLGFCVVATGAFYAGLRGGAAARPLGLGVGLLGAFWASSSYTFSRSYVVLQPVAYAALGLMLVVMARRGRVGGGWDAVVRAGTVPLLTMILASPLAAVVANPLAVNEAAASLRTTIGNGLAVEPMLPDADPGLQALLVEAGVRPDDPIAFPGHLLGNLLPPWTPGGEPAGERVVVTRDWLPGHPFVSLRYVPEGRGPVYLARFVERARLSGWLVRRKTGDGASVEASAFSSGLEPWFYDVVGRSHVPSRVYENADWQVAWFDYVGDRTDVVRPAYRYGQFAPLPPDVALDGQPLSETPHPELWTMFGEGWGLLDPELGGRWAGSGSELWMYSPESRTATLRFTPSYVRGGNALIVVVNDDEADARALTARRPFEASIALQAGWNRIGFEIVSVPDILRAERTEARRAARGQAGESPRELPRGETGGEQSGRERRGRATAGSNATPAAVATPTGEVEAPGGGTPSAEAASPGVGTPVAGATPSGSPPEGEEGGGMVLPRVDIDSR